MKILLITDKFAPERGGSQIILANLYQHLQGHEVTILTRVTAGDAEFDATYPHRVIRIPWPKVPKLRSAEFAWRLWRAACRLCAIERFDQIHCGQPLETGPVGVQVAKRFGIPAVIHTFAEDVTSFEEHPVLGSVLRNTLRRASAVSTISSYTFERLEKLGVAKQRIRLLYPGLNPEEWTRTAGVPELRSKLGVEGRKVILSISRLIPRKGQDTVLQALPAVLKAVPNALYVIVGDGPERGRLEQLAERLGVADYVRFVGSIPNTETQTYYRCCDVFVMPNRRMPNGDIEGFGLVFLEANACGKPVVGGRSGGAVDAIVDGETGYLVDPTSPDEVAERLIRLLLDPALAARLGEQGRVRTVASFTWENSGRCLGTIVSLAAS